MKHKHLIIYILASLTLVLGVGTVLLLRYGNPQWNRWIYIFQRFHWKKDYIEMPEDYSGKWMEWKKNGDPVSLENFQNGIKNGPYKKWEDGNLVEFGKYLNDRLNGIKIIYYKGGNVYSKTPFLNGQWHGKNQAWYNSGEKLSEYNFSYHGFDGSYFEWYKNGQIKESGSYSKGQLDGDIKTFSEEGALVGHQVYFKGKCQNIFILNGKKLSISEKTKIINETRRSEFRFGIFIPKNLKEIKEFYGNGQLFCHGFLNNGFKDNEWKWFFDNGQLHMKTNFKRQSPDGEFLEYDKNGELVTSETYKNGTLIQIHVRGKIKFSLEDSKIEIEKEKAEFEKSLNSTE